MAGFPHTFPFPFFTGGTAATNVPGLWPAALNGRSLMIDDTGDTWTHQGIQSLRAQADQSTTPSEQSLNPEGLWRRARDSWHHGAGQSIADRTGTTSFGVTFGGRTGSDQYQYRSSKGIDPWTLYQLNLLPDTDQKHASVNTNRFLASAGDRLYMSDGTALAYTTDVTVDAPVWINVTGVSGTAITGIASDGFNVYVADGAGLYSTTTAGATASSYNTTDSDGVAYVKGRLMVSKNNIITNVTGTITQDIVFTHPNTAFRWVGFAEGSAGIYTAGFAGDKSIIYLITIADDGTTLSVPRQVGELPDGEVISSIGGYLGFILLGTTNGVRFAEPDTSGVLQIGPLVPTDTTVRCFEGQGRYVWFGWENYDGVSTGLGRLDLTAFPETVDTGAKVPAYSSDLMAAGQGTVTSLASFNGLRVFSVSGVGIFAETTTLVASGTIDSGRITYGLPDDKTAISLDVRTAPLDGSYTTAVALNGGAFINNGSESGHDDTGTEFPVENTTGEFFEIRITLTRDTSPTLGPVIHRWTLKVTQGANDGANEYLVVPFLLSNPQRIGQQEFKVDVRFERDAIKALRRSRRVVVYQEADQSYRVQVENFQWVPNGLRQDEDGTWEVSNGTMITQMKRLN